ncbi:conserved unknown protein [Ectocarpus siliculosus]|uniref:Signal recognition particle SRP54 subunit M-domain domain-containing protein n=1 Tax=Ectocarpus siliculosus TaxID=2880 RepID=D8LNI7_ECTSI|nr:conserved unknown protein [Ectocarpus siliculosus]|eukprot:CBN79862.1 conserved unknown protein [Ectocarpus siliculosus]
MAMRRSLPTLRPIVSASVSGAGRMAPPSCSLRGSGCSGGGGGGRDWRVLLPTGRGVEGAGVRGFGVMDSVQDKIINRNTAKQEKQFKEQMEELSLKESFNLDDFAKIIEEPLDKFSAKLPWNKSREELQAMKMQKKVLEGLTPLQRKNPESIRHGHRQRIADRAGVTTEDVNKALAAYRELKAMHGWLSTRRKRKERIPSTQEELHVMATDPSGTMLMNFMKVKRSNSGKPSFAF